MRTLQAPPEARALPPRRLTVQMSGVASVTAAARYVPKHRTLHTGFNLSRREGPRPLDLIVIPFLQKG